MTLDIIVPHYKEPWKTCKYLFDTIATQRGINFEDIKVIVVNDGDCLLNEYFTEIYPYKIEYLVKNHGGVSAARNYGLDHSTADYVMFCDIDDGFLSNYGLHLVFSAMNEGFDLLTSNFIEESKAANGAPLILPHKDDMTFIHGKVYKRQFLDENGLRFDPSLTIHEDGYFNLIVYTAAKHVGKTKKVETPFYMWRWNDDSVVRANRGDFVLKTYSNLMDARINTCKEMERRGYDKEFRISVMMTVLNSYYDFQKTAYHKTENQKYLRKAEEAFKRYWTLYKKVFNDCTNAEISEVSVSARANAIANGMLFEQQDLRSFLKHIENDVK